MHKNIVMAFTGKLWGNFKAAFDYHAGVAEEIELRSIMADANKIFAVEKGENDLFTNEAAKIQALVHAVADLMALSIKRGMGKPSPNMIKLARLFIYLRNHTVLKLKVLRKVHEDALDIVEDAKKSEKIDEDIAKINALNKSSTQFKNSASQLSRKRLQIRKSAKMLDEKAKELEKAVYAIGTYTTKMIKILTGKPCKDRYFGNLNFPYFLTKEILGMHATKEMGEAVFEIKDDVDNLVKVLRNQLAAIPAFEKSVKDIKKRDRKILRIERRARTAISRAA